MNLYCTWRAAMALTVLTCCGCSSLSHLGEPSYVAARDETAAVESIELAFPDGRGVGAFVSAIDPGDAPHAVNAQKYRVSVIFDSGNHTTLVQDGRVALAVGQRVQLVHGQALPTTQVDVPHLAPTPPF